MNIVEIYDAVYNRLVDEVENATIVRTAVDALEIEKANYGMFNPYVSISFGGPVEAASGRHIQNRRMNLLKSWCSVTVVSPRNEDTVKIAEQVIDALWNYAPPNAAPLVMTGGMAQSVSNEQSKPAKYIHTIMFEIPHNMRTMVE